MKTVFAGIETKSRGNYLKKGKALVLKEPIELSPAVSILGLSRDSNGNSLLQIETPKGKRSIQYKNYGMSSIDIDELAEGHFVERRQNDVKQIIEWGTVKAAGPNRRVRDALDFRQGDELSEKYRNTILTPEFKGAEHIGWFATKQNPASGFMLHSPDIADIQWFGKQGESIVNVFRIRTDKGNTSLVKMDAKKGKVHFFDNEKYKNTDQIHWQKPDFYQILVVNPDAEKLLR